MRRYPPGPRNFNAAIGLTWRHAACLWRDPLKFVESLRRFGDLVFFRAFGYRIYVANHPRLIREVLINKRDAFRKSPRDTRAVRQLLGNGVLVSEGDFWLRQRRLLQKAFHSSRMDAYASVVVGQTLRKLREWQHADVVDVAEEMTDLTIRIAAQTMFGVDLAERTTDLSQAARVLSDQFSHESRAYYIAPVAAPAAAEAETVGHGSLRPVHL
jgi:pentalenene oxygenase